MTREHSGAKKKRSTENRRPAQPTAQGIETQAAELCSTIRMARTTLLRAAHGSR